MSDPMTGNDACVSMHTALRKCCESPASNVMYQVVSLVCDFKPYNLNPWRLFGAAVADAIATGVQRGKKDHIDPVLAVEDYFPNYVVQRFEARFHKACKERRDAGRELSDKTHSAYYALWYSLKLLSQEDWDGMLSYL